MSAESQPETCSDVAFALLSPCIATACFAPRGMLLPALARSFLRLHPVQQHSKERPPTAIPISLPQQLPHQATPAVSFATAPTTVMRALAGFLSGSFGATCLSPGYIAAPCFLERCPIQQGVWPGALDIGWDAPLRMSLAVYPTQYHAYSIIY